MLVSTPAFAVDEITAVPMQDAATGAFRPQEDSYLNSGPAPALLRAFTDAVAHLRLAEAPLPRVVYPQGQVGLGAARADRRRRPRRHRPRRRHRSRPRGGVRALDAAAHL